jgi:hypothetical protein
MISPVALNIWRLSAIATADSIADPENFNVNRFEREQAQ